MEMNMGVSILTSTLNFKPLYRHYHPHFLNCCHLEPFDTLETILKKMFWGCLILL